MVYYKDTNNVAYRKRYQQVIFFYSLDATNNFLKEKGSDVIDIKGNNANVPCLIVYWKYEEKIII